MGRRERRQEVNRQRWGQVAIGILLVLLMTLSIVQFGANSTNDNSLTFNDYKFQLTEDGWQVKVDGERLTLHSVPLEGNTSLAYMQSVFRTTTRVKSDPAIGGLLRGAQGLQLTFDANIPPEYLQPLELARFELSDTFPAVNGVLEESETYASLPVITCDAASETAPVIAFHVNSTLSNVSITRDGSCLTVVSGPLETLVAKDFLILAAKGVIPDAR